MWRFISIVILLFSLACGSRNEGKESVEIKDIIDEKGKDAPEISFIKTSHDFGKISEGEVVGTNFSFINTGKSNLLILGASASCGCTVPKWSKEPIAPGKNGTLEVIFDSSGREGKQNKSITVSTNASDQNIVLFITAEVEAQK